MISIAGMSRTSPSAATTKSNVLFINLIAGSDAIEIAPALAPRPEPLGRSRYRVKREFGPMKRPGGLPQPVVNADRRLPAKDLAGPAAIDLQGIDQAIDDVPPAKHARAGLQERGRNGHDPGLPAERRREAAEQLGRRHVL